MAKDYRPTLSNELQDRHFPEFHHGGKGFKPRSRGRLNNKTSSSEFAKNWDRIFGKKDGED